MDDNQRKRLEEVALFRYAAIADLIHLEPGTRNRLIKARATHLGTGPYKLSARTIHRWLRLYCAGGFDALRPKVRTNVGEPSRRDHNDPTKEQ
jgi:putative transposase